MIIYITPFYKKRKIVHVENNNSTTHINYDTEKNVRVRKIFVCQKQNKNHRISDLPYICTYNEGGGEKIHKESHFFFKKIKN